MRLIILILACKGFLISDRCHVRFATLVDKNRDVRDDIKYTWTNLKIVRLGDRSNTWMGRTRTDGPDEFEPTKFDCSKVNQQSVLNLLSPSYTFTILAMVELQLTPIYQVVMHRHES